MRALSLALAAAALLRKEAPLGRGEHRPSPDPTAQQQPPGARWSGGSAVFAPEAWGPEQEADIRKTFANCTHIFLDLGSNIGVHVRFLFEGARYPKSPSATGFFTERFGAPAQRSRPSRETGLCALGVEANPARAARLRRLEECYAQRGWTVKFLVPTALAARSNDVVQLWTHQDMDREDVGASAAGNSAPGHGTRVPVPTLDLSAVLPALPPGAELAAKMDIEGAEFEVLPRLDEAGALCRIRSVQVEWHDAGNTRMAPALRSAIAAKYGDDTLRRVRAAYGSYAPGCDRPAQFVTADDETYGEDRENPLSC